jgi:Ca2+:H+ antiporter
VLASLPLSSGTAGTALTVVFAPLQLIALGLVVLVYWLISHDGETNWLEGLQFLSFYALIAIVSFALPGR